MQDPDFISLFVAPLEAAGINYMITGSVASSIYGEPRNTLDIDLVKILDIRHPQSTISSLASCVLKSCVSLHFSFSAFQNFSIYP